MDNASRISQTFIEEARFFESQEKGKMKRETLYDRKFEEISLQEYYEEMLKDEKANTKVKHVRYYEECINIFQFYFEEGRNILYQRKQTLHLAMTYFTQTILS